MTTEAEDALADLYEGRAEAGLAGFRPHTIAVVYRFAAGSPRSIVGDEVIPITEANGQSPKMRIVSEEERTIAGLPEGTLDWGPITPAFPGGGTNIATLRGDELQQGDLLLYRVDGPMYPTGAYFSKVSLTHDRALRIMLRIQPRETIP